MQYERIKQNDTKTMAPRLCTQSKEDPVRERGCIDPENLLPPEKITVTGGRIIRSRSKLIDGTVCRVHSVFRKDGSLPKRLLTLMENDSKNTSDPPSENSSDSSVKSLDSDGNL